MREEHPLNVNDPTEVIEDGSSISFNDIHFPNTCEPVHLTEVGIVIEVNFLHS